MQYLRFSLLLCILFNQALFAKDEDILSKSRLQIFTYDEKKNNEDSARLRKDWINPIMYSYSKNYTDLYDTSKSKISISQPIFKSGGIFAAISYANSLQKYSHLAINLQKKAMIKDATTTLFNINKIDLSIKKQELLLKNANIDVQRKKEQVFNGFLDTSYLDNAILAANTNSNLLAELKYQKFELINAFSNLASADYKSFVLPVLSLIQEDEYLNKNILIKQSAYDIKSKYQFKNMTQARYLPTFNLNYDYTKYHEIDNNKALNKDGIKTYGFSIQIPLDVRTFNEIQSSKLSYLKAKVNKENLILEQKNYFNSKKAKIVMLEEKTVIAKSDYKLYNSLLATISEEQGAGLKTQSDVDTLKNSQKIKALEIKILNYDKQIELLDLYAYIN